jgi:hypothetical protein
MAQANPRRLSFDRADWEDQVLGSLLPESAKLVACDLRRWMKPDGWVYRSVKETAARLNMAPRIVERARAGLLGARFVERERRGGGFLSGGRAGRATESRARLPVTLPPPVADDSPATSIG